MSSHAATGTTTDFVVIRDYEPGDEQACQNIVREAIMSTVNRYFILGITRERPFQMIIPCCVLIFTFLGAPLFVILGSIPIVIGLMYMCVWLSHVRKHFHFNSDMVNIPSAFIRFWVAEVYEMVLDTKTPRNIKYTFINQHEAQNMDHMDPSLCRRRIVGTIAVTRCATSKSSARVKKMGIQKNYRRKGIASALLDTAIQFCVEKGYKCVELATTESHLAACDLYLKKDFKLKNIYLERSVGTLLTVSVLEFVLQIKS